MKSVSSAKKAPNPSYAELSDLALRDAILRREEGAWLELMRRYRSLIFGCIHKALSKFTAVLASETADEIFSEVCVNLLRDEMKKLRLYDPNRGSKLSSWIGMIAINTAYDHLRACARIPVLDQIDGYPHFVDERPGPLESLLSLERTRQLYRLAEDLSSRDRHFLDLYFRRELSPKEIARRMQISVKTVYSKRNKIQRRLMQLVPPAPDATPVAA
jgi:RNA polymerase sigma-70 factor (ECF subfamily)